MSVRGVAQLRQLILRYSDLDGSSRGMRSVLPPCSKPLIAEIRYDFIGSAFLVLSFIVGVGNMIAGILLGPI